MALDKPEAYTVIPVQWGSAESDVVRSIRFSVFVDEQKVPADLELDDVDPTAFHLLAINQEGKACGTGRLYAAVENPTVAKIGRMAVLAECRGTGCGSALLTAMVAEARRQGYKEAGLSAQAHAVPFYEKHGFVVEGEQYEDAGIPHYWMRRSLL